MEGSTCEEVEGGGVRSKVNLGNEKRKGEREKGRKGEREKGRKGERKKGRKEERKQGRKEEREKGRKGESKDEKKRKEKGKRREGKKRRRKIQGYPSLTGEKDITLPKNYGQQNGGESIPFHLSVVRMWIWILDIGYWICGCVNVWMCGCVRV